MVRNYGVNIWGKFREVQGSIWVRSPFKHHLLIMKEVAERLGFWQHFSELHGLKGTEAKSRSGWTRSRLDTRLYLDYRRTPTDNKIKNNERRQKTRTIISRDNIWNERYFSHQKRSNQEDRMSGLEGKNFQMAPEINSRLEAAWHEGEAVKLLWKHACPSRDWQAHINII